MIMSKTHKNSSKDPNRRLVQKPTIAPALKRAPTAAIPIPGLAPKKTVTSANSIEAAFDKLTKSKNSKSWAARNDKVSDQDRIIAIKVDDNRTIHADCADKVNIQVPSSASQIAKMAVYAYQAPQIAMTGGLTCADCNKSIVGAVKKRKTD